MLESVLKAYLKDTFDMTIKRVNLFKSANKKDMEGLIEKLFYNYVISNMRFNFLKQSRIYLLWVISKFRLKTGQNLKILKKKKQIFFIQNFFESNCASNMFFHTSIQKNFEPKHHYCLFVFNLQKTRF